MNTNQFARYNLRIPSFKCTLILSFCITLSLANATNLKGFFLPAPSIGPGETCEAVNCEAGFFQTIDNDGKLVRYEYDNFTLDFTVISVFGFTVNATAFNIVDNYLYTIARDTRRLIRFSSDGSWTSLGILSLPETVVVGSFDNDGNYYVTGIDRPNIYRIDVNTLEVEIIPIAQGPNFRPADWVYVECEDKLYGVGNNNLLYSFDPNTATVTTIILTGDVATGFYGAAFTDITGALYVSNNNTGNIYSIDVTNGVSTFLLNGPPSGTNDGTSCPCSVPPFPTLSPQDDEICITDDESVQIFLNDNHSFADIDNSSFEIVQQPTNGTILYTQSSGSVFYLSNDPSQPDSFVYRVCLDLQVEFCEEATVRYQPSFSSVIEGTICDGEEFIVDGFSFTEEGSFDLTYIASNGCDSIITLVLEVDGAADQIFTEEFCAEEEFTFNDEVYTESGVFEFDFMTTSGCDSTVVLDLTVHPVFEEFLQQSICLGEEYIFDGQVFDTTGIYTISYLTVNGCDSIYTIDLLVNENVETNIEGSLCGGEVFELNGIAYSESGIFTQDLTTVNGCDSLITLTLEVADNVEASISRRICEGEELSFEDGTVLSESGDYELILQASNGCDSTLIVRVDVLENPIAQLAEEICASEIFTLPDGTEFDASGTYELNYTAANGCDSTLFLNLLVNDVFEENIEAFICEGESFMIGNEEFTETGDYVSQFLTSNNCDSIINLALTVSETITINMEQEICEGDSFVFGPNTLSTTGVYEQNLLTSNNCDSSIILDLRVLQNVENNFSVAICEGSSFELGGMTYTEEGQYTAQFTAANNCDSTVTVELSIAPNFTLDLSESICEGESFFFRGVEYTDAGDFELFVEGEAGCDSIINLSIQQFTVSTELISTSICEGEEFTIGGITYTEEGIFEQNLFTTNGCDSTVTIDLKVNPEFVISLEETICEGEQVQVGTEVFTEGGTYEVIFSTVAGCDSLVILDLTENRNELVNLNQEICEGEEVTVGTEVYTTTGVFTNNFNTTQGCDSTVVLDLVVHSNYEIVEQAQICASETFDFAGQAFTTTGIHEVRLQTINGCDSILILDLFVSDTQATNLSETICFGSAFIFGGDELTEEGEYTQNLITSAGCDSTVVLNLSLADRFETNLSEHICEGEEVEIGSEVFTETGFYEVLLLASNGCDSLVSLDLVQFFPSDVSLEARICEGETYTFGSEELDEEGQYSQALMNVNGCDSIVSLDLTILEVFEFEFDQEICDGESYEIGSSSYSDAGTYFDTFSTADGCDSTIVTHLVVRAHTMSEQELFTCIEEEVGQETLILSNSFGCDSTVVITTSLSPASECSVVVALTGMTIPCMEELGLLNVEILVGTPPFTVNWTGPQDGNTTQSELGAFTIKDLPPGSYSIEVIDDNGNITNSNAEILVLEEPDVIAVAPLNASGFNIDCFGGTTGAASVNGIGGTAPYTYLWSTGETSEEIQNLSAGIYSVTLTDANNCIDTTLVELNEPTALVLDLDPIDLTCDDAQSGVVTISSSGGGAPYMYSLNDSDVQSENVFLDLAQGDYNSLVVDANGCTIEGEFTLNMPTAVEVNLGEDISVELGDPVSIQAALNLDIEDISEIIWSPNLDTDCDDCLVQTFFPSESGIYSILVVDVNGCEHIDEIVINVDTDQTIYVPNAFSPNGDGINDVFTLYSESRFSPIISELHIYDRWGTEVFVNFDFPPNADEFGWNGDFRGEAYNPGVFVFHATVKFLDGSTAFFKGDVTLVK